MTAILLALLAWAILDWFLGRPAILVAAALLLLWVLWTEAAPWYRDWRSNRRIRRRIAQIRAEIEREAGLG